jgi:hypothetical protein
LKSDNTPEGSVPTFWPGRPSISLKANKTFPNVESGSLLDLSPVLLSHAWYLEEAFGEKNLERSEKKTLTGPMAALLSIQIISIPL